MLFRPKGRKLFFFSAPPPQGLRSVHNFITELRFVLMCFPSGKTFFFLSKQSFESTYPERSAGFSIF
jgi:hypothetical protein